MGNVTCIYYTSNREDPQFEKKIQQTLLEAVGDLPIISVSQKPIDFGTNIVMPIGRSQLSMFKQILVGLIGIETDIVFFCEHDCLYHPSHFEFTPTKKDKFFYNKNRWQVDSKTGQALFRHTRCTSLVVAYRDLLIKHFTDLLELIDKSGYRRSRMGFAPGTHRFEGMKCHGVRDFMSEHPCIDVRHASNYTPTRWKKEEHRNKHSLKGWKESDSVPFWGKTKGRFDEFLRELT